MLGMRRIDAYKIVVKVFLYVFVALLGIILLDVGLEHNNIEVALLGSLGFIGGLLALFFLMLRVLTQIIEDYIAR